MGVILNCPIFIGDDVDNMGHVLDEQTPTSFYVVTGRLLGPTLQKRGSNYSIYTANSSPSTSFKISML